MAFELPGSAAFSARAGLGVLAAALALATAVSLASAVQAQGVQARGIDAACPRAAQEALPSGGHTSGFPDVEGNVHEAAINCLAHWGIARGRDGAYLPAQAIRRDQMASFLARTLLPSDFQLPEGQAETFADTHGNVHEGNINALAEAGIVQGRSGGTFAPAAPVSRAAMASFVARTLETVTGEALDGGETAFPDAEGNVHEANINALASLGIVQGRADGTYAPDERVRRDQMASFLARGMDYLAAQGHWPVPDSVELTPAEDTNPANFVHRLRGTVFNQRGQDDPGDTYHGADVRIEVYREADGDHTLVHTDRVVSGLGGDLFFAYNAGAATGDQDVIAACPLHAGETPGEDTQWCATVDTVDGQSTVEADQDRGADTVTTSWTDPVEAEAAGDGHYSGNVIAHDVEAATVDVQTGERPGGGGERLVRLAYHGADRFTVNTAESNHPDATVGQFACAVQAGLDHDDEAYPNLSAEYRVEGSTLFDLSTPADVGHCFPDEAGDTVPCEGSENGVVYRTRYPADWWASDGTQAEPCRWFHPERFDMPDEPQDVPGVAILLRIVDVPFDTASDLSPERHRLISERETVVDGRPAIVQEYVQQEETIYPAGTTHYRFLVDLDGRTALATASEVSTADFEESKAVLDQLRASFEVTATTSAS